MKYSIPAVLLILLLAALLPLTNGTQDRRPFEITSVSIIFDKTDAAITINYEFPKLMKLYIILLGSKDIEPDIDALFPEFEYRIIKLDQNHAVLQAKNVSRYEKGYYLHDAKKLGDNIKTVYIYTPDSRIVKQYSNINSTPDIFYRS